jgi:hypothetical protein
MNARNTVDRTDPLRLHECAGGGSGSGARSAIVAVAVTVKLEKPDAKGDHMSV